MLKYIGKTFGTDELASKNLIIACFASLLTTMAILFTNLGLFVFLQDIIVPILEKQPIELDIMKYLYIIAGLIVLLVLSVYLKYSKSYIPVYMAAAKKRIGIGERLRKLPLSFFGKKDIADITTTIMKDAASLEDVFSAYIPTLFSAIVSTVLMCIGIFIYNPTLGLAIFWCVPISFGLFFLSKNIQTKEGGKSKAIIIKYLDKLQQTIENIKDIKSNNREKYHEDVMLSSFKDLETSLKKTEFILGTLITAIQMILKVGMASTVLVSVTMLLDNTISSLEFFIFLMIATRIYDPLLSAMVNLGALFQAFLSINRTKEFETIAIQEGTTEVSYDGYDIAFENVGFSYADSSVDAKDVVIDNVCFTAKQGEVTALVGPSGGGKSTALKLAARFWELNSGKITIGNNDISKIDPETLLNSISIVFQDVVLFNNTVMENIRIGRKGATDEEVMQAAKDAMCHDFIMAMPNGYKTMIGENGSKISGGERQRLSIARALLKDAPIVLLDEATSSLDIKNETAVQGAIANLTKDKTVMVIAHRMRTIMGANKIVVLKDGNVAQMGNHTELIAQDGPYQTMVNLQMNSANWAL